MKTYTLDTIEDMLEALDYIQRKCYEDFKRLKGCPRTCPLRISLACSGPSIDRYQACDIERKETIKNIIEAEPESEELARKLGIWY